MKNWVRKIHLIAGLIIGLIVFIVATTGCLYAFEEEFRNILYKNELDIKAENNHKPVAELIKTVKTNYPKEKIKNIKIKQDATSSIEFIFKNKKSVFVNPYSGNIIGAINKENDFFGIVLQLHRSLFLGDVGKIITGTSALVFILMLITGIIIWWPRNKEVLKQSLSIKPNASFKRKTLDWHRALGFYASWIIIFTALTGIIWSFKWAENTMYWMTNSKKEERKEFHSEPLSDSTTISIDSVLKKVENYQLTSKECFIAMPEDSAGVYRITFRYDNGGFYKRADQFFLDQYSGKIIKAKLFKDAQLGDKLKSINYDIHTGKAFGFTGQLIVFFASLIAASLPITGFLIWKNKRY